MKALRTLLLGLVLASAGLVIASVAPARHSGELTSAATRSLKPAAALAADIARAEGECALAANPVTARFIQFGF